MRRLVNFAFLLLLGTSSSFATIYHVSTTGNDSGDGSSANPWRTLKNASTKVAPNQGHIIRLSAGTFVEVGPVDIPPGVSVEGAGINITIIKSASSFFYNPATPGFSPDRFLINFRSSAPTNGAQSIKNLTIDGDGKRLHGGIYVTNRNNVLVENIRVQFVNFCAIWFWGVRDSAIKGIQLKDCAWGSTGWCSAALHVTNSTNIDVANFDIDESVGYGIKNMGHTANTPFSNIKIHDGRVSVNPTGIWNNGNAPNITIEFWANSFPGTEIYNCYIDNHISLVHDAVLPQPTAPMKIYNNVFDILGPRTKGNGYGMELSINDVEVYNNWFNGGATAIVNWGRRQYRNWQIHHNTFYGIRSGYPTAVINSNKGGLLNANIYNNTVEMTGTATVNFLEFNNGSIGENINIRNNLIINSNTSYQHYTNRFISIEQGSTIKNLQVSNNLLFRLPIGNVAGTYTNNLTSDPRINKTGARPSPYYIPTAASPVIDAGVNVGLPFGGSAPDMGAFEFNTQVTAPPPNVLPQVNITSPANTSTFTAGSSITINANATDSDGSIGRVEFFRGTTKLGEDLTSPFSFVWANVPAGNYTLTAKATDNKSGITTSTPITIAVTNPNTPPVISLTSPANNALFTTGSTVTISANASDPGGSISKVEFYRGTTKLGEDLTSPFSFAWTNVPGGTHTISAKAIDNQNATTTSSTVTITVSAANNPPTVSITSPSNNATFTAGATIAINATASDANGSVSKVEFFNGQVKLGEDVTSPYSFSWTTVPAGNYSITAKATDNQNASTTSTAISVVVIPPNVPPTVSLTSPTSNSSFDAGTSITITANATHSAGTISKVEFFNGTTKLGEVRSPPYILVWTNAPVGTHSLGAKATDSKNLVGNSSLTQIIVSKANSLPVVALTSPVNNSVFPVSSSITITATASDSDGSIAKVEFFRGNTKLGEDLTSPFSFIWNNAPEGSYVLTARATDNQNAVAISAPRNINVNPSPTPPSVSITNPSNNTSFFSNSNITITANASTPSGTISKVEFFNGNTKLGEDVTSPYTFTWNNVPVGSYSLTAKAINSQNATTTSAAVNVIVNAVSSPPVINITSPTNNSVFIAGSNITIAANATDANGSITKVEFFNGTDKLGEDQTSPYNLVWTNIPEGTHLIVAKATDNQGTTTDAEVQIFVNAANQPPEANAGNDVTIQLPTNNLTINGAGTDADGIISTYTWTQISGPNDISFTQDSFGELQLFDLKEGTFVFELTVTDNGNLSSSDRVTVIVSPSLLALEQIPRFFSPNEDGVNDVWEWPSIGHYENSQLMIFNRFGQKVFDAESYQNNWDGTMNGKPLQEDAYYYIIKLTNTEIKGSVRIVR